MVSHITGRFSRRLRILASLRICGRLREKLHKKILALDYDSYRAQSPGKLMSYVITDVNSMQSLFVAALVLLVVESALIGLGLVLIFLVDWRLALVPAVLLPLHALLYLKIKKPQREASRECRYTSSCLWNFSTQRFNGIKTIMAYAREPKVLLNFLRLGACYLRDAVFVSRCSAIINCNAWLIHGLGTGLVYVIGTMLVINGGMSIGDMVMFCGIVGFLFSQILELSSLNAYFASMNVVLNRLYTILDMEIRIKDSPDAAPLAEPVKGKITFDHVTFDYPQSSRTSLKDVTVTIEPGEWLCLMGASGSGKSTMVGLLTRLYEPQQGEIRIDGQNLAKIQLASLRRNMVLVPQEPQIFGGTVADNICYGAAGFAPRQIMAAAQAAELHEAIMELPAKYETILGEKGVSFSGGQRQRLSLARALITDPRILILDDCTSSLDAETEKRIQETLAQVMEKRTAIIVSQRVSMAQYCHRILVLGRGEIIESGSHEELLANNGFYAQLYRRQTLGTDTRASA